MWLLHEIHFLCGVLASKFDNVREETIPDTVEVNEDLMSILEFQVVFQHNYGSHSHAIHQDDTVGLRKIRLSLNESQQKTNVILTQIVSL